ncbi:MAG: NAD(P)/FAD-dependent oxidoreductase [Deltaproteobacteria bacterium]|nr:NAD(P)/FAD-dependent oxidoreductase [Nannocystaceae bacterium]
MQLDVAILGGGLAGATIARQLRRRLPDLAIGLFERNDDGGYKVGESTVEIASNYFTRRLGLGSYLYQEHLPKNGLRFFFDGPERDQPLERLGEIGGDGLPFHPSFQLDRRRIDADLRRMNQADGVLVRENVKVTELQPGSGGAPHRFTLDDGTSVQTRWLVDASGRARLLARARGETRIDTGHGLAAAWGRIRDCGDMDDRGPTEWRSRVRNTSRFLSTNHFMYPGYWIWFIPISRGVMSIGVVCDRALFKDAWRTTEGLLAFCREHRAPRDLLEGCTPLDAMGYASVPYGCDRFFDGADRWARVGEAAAFSDPLYSPGSDFIAMENDYATELIVMDIAGESREALAERSALYDAFVQFRFESTLRVYRDLYGTLGSYELFSLKWDFDMHCYYNLWYQQYATDRHLDPGELKDQVGMREPILAQLANFSKLFRTAEHELRARGHYHRGNLGVLSHPLRSIDFAMDVGRPRPRKQILRAVSAIANRTRAGVLALLDGEAADTTPWPLGDYMFERDLRRSAAV